MSIHTDHEIPAEGWVTGEDDGLTIPLTCTTCWCRVGPEYLADHTEWHQKQETRTNLAAIGL